MGLRIWVQVWCEVDPTLNVRIDRATGQPAVEAGDQLLRVSPLGRAGVAAALALDRAEVTAFALATDQEDALRHAIAAGAERGVTIRCEGSEDVPLEALAGWLRRERPDVIIADRWAGLVAGRLGWAHLAGLADLRVEAGVLRAVRFLGRGHREEVSARLPTLVRLQDGAGQMPYVARARLAAAELIPIVAEVLPASIARSSDADPVQLARARVRGGALPPPAASSGSSRLQALLGSAVPATARAKESDTMGPEQQAEEFVRYLMHHELLPERWFAKHPVKQE